MKVGKTAQYWFDAQGGAKGLHFLERVYVQRVNHCHGEDAAQFVNRQDLQPQAHIFRNNAADLIGYLIVLEAEVGGLALLDQILGQFNLVYKPFFHKDLTKESIVFSLFGNGVLQLLLGDDVILQQQIPQLLGPLAARQFSG